MRVCLLSSWILASEQLAAGGATWRSTKSPLTKESLLIAWAVPTVPTSFLCLLLTEREDFFPTQATADAL